MLNNIMSYDNGNVLKDYFPELFWDRSQHLGNSPADRKLISPKQCLLPNGLDCLDGRDASLQGYMPGTVPKLT